MFLINYNLYLIILVVIFDLQLIIAHDKTDPVPTSYDVVLRPNMIDMTFDGEVLIGVRTFRKENKIRLSSQGLVITSVDLKWEGQMSVLESHSVDNEHERLDIKVDNLFAGNHTIKVTFQGQIRDPAVGLFVSFCRSENIRSWIAGASLEPINARSVFPSFDTNENEVPLKLHLILNNDYKTVTPIPATTSMLETFQNVDLNFDEVHLAQLGWAFYPSDNKVQKIQSENGHTAITCRYNNWQMFTNDIAKEMSNYTGIELTGTQWIMMPDFPTSFSSSKNIIFIREHLLENSSYTNKMDLRENMMKVSEAYAQQLFGQMIRVQWWPHIWLTKGLANFMRYKITEKVDNKFKSHSYIIGNVLPRVLERESIPHSLSRHAHSKQDILSMYDQDLFDRAGLIMNMIEDRVGENAFRRAIIDFVNKTIGNGSANPTHFWDSLKDNSQNFPEDRTVEEVLNAWINSSGYPVVNVRRDKDHLHITQERIFKENSKSLPGYWWIPISVTSQTIRGERKFWLRPHGNLRINLPINDNWYMINENGKGFYRVNYDLENWKNISEAISRKELAGMARARILDDSLGLAETNHLSYSVPLAFTKHLADEFNGCPQFLPWSATVRHLVTVRTTLEKYSKSLFDEYTSKLIEYYIFGTSLSSGQLQEEMVLISLEKKTVTVNSTNLATMLNKYNQIKNLCQNNPYCSNIIDYFKAVTIEENNSVENMLDVVQCFEVEQDSDNETLIDDWLNMYKQYPSATTEMKIMKSLSCLKKTSHRIRLLNAFINDSSSLKRQDFVNVVTEMSYSEESVDDIIDWMSNNIMIINEYVSGDMSMVTNILLALSEKISNERRIDKLKEIVETIERNNQLPNQLDRPQIHRAMFRMEQNFERRRRHSNEIISWLKNPDHAETFASSAVNGASAILSVLLSFILIFLRFISI